MAFETKRATLTRKVLLAVNATFQPECSAEEVAFAVDRLEEVIRLAHPDVQRIL